MRQSGWWFGMALVALVLCASASEAATSAMDVGIGDRFTGSIGTAGVDTVEARFNVVQGTSLKLTARATNGSSLQPTIVLRDGSGTAIETGATGQIEWLPVRHVVYFVTAPSSGNFTMEVGGASGAGTFTASITGTLPESIRLSNLSGMVTNSFTDEGLAGVAVSMGPFSLTTDATGAYSAAMPAGTYSAAFQMADFAGATEAVELQAGVAATLDVGLEPVPRVIIDASVSGDAVPGATLNGTVDVETRDGSSVQSISWTQLEGVTAAFGDPDQGTTTLTLGAGINYRDQLLHTLSEPPIQLPPGIPPPAGEFPGGLQNRFGIVGISPFPLEEAGLVVLEVEVVTTLGTYHEEVELHTHLLWKPSTGIRNVPIGVPVLLQAKEQATYDWDLRPPETSNASLLDEATRNPTFTPDVPGLYEVDVTDLSGPAPLTLEIYAGTWRGTIIEKDVDDRAVPDGACMVCHDSFAPDMFTPWAETGHAEIFADNLDTSTHYGTNCFSCHMVGYDPDVDNGGVDDAPGFQEFLDAGFLNNPGDNWTETLERFPAVSRLANIQCENCHGPQSAEPGEDNEAHGWNVQPTEPRLSLSSDVCAVCHGEPLRHGRFQQWQLSGHANYELAIDEGEDENCSRCHTANGFLAWVPVLLGEVPGDPEDDVEITWTVDEVHPQTCVTCHDPHAIGTTSGNANDATVRISGDTPPLPAGFTVAEAGRGAICMTCHNSRRGLRNDGNFGDVYGTSEAARAPHGSAQTDVVMGQNAYLAEVGVKNSHYQVTDTCVGCHMDETPPPDLLSYRQGGTNHTFFAGAEICAECHGEGFDADDVQGGVQSLLDDLQSLLEAGLLELIADQIDAGNTIDLDGDTVPDITDAGDVAEIGFGGYRGRQSITVTFTNDTTIGPRRMSDVDVLNSLGTVIGTLYDFADPSLIKSGWNWNLFTNDGSQGVHNPSFAWSTLLASRQALLAGGGTEAAQMLEDRIRPRMMSDEADRPRALRSRRGRTRANLAR